MWQCHSCKAWSSNPRSHCFGCAACKDGQQLLRDHVTAQPETGTDVGRAQALATPPAQAGVETEEPVSGKKALKKHVQRSIDKLVAAKEKLPEEEGREVAQGITERIKGLQLQKDGLISLTARRKKASAQLEESKKAVESKRKALQQAQEDLEEARQKHAAAQEACASVEQEIEEEEDEDDECMPDADQDKGRESVCSFFAVGGDTGGAHGGFTDLSRSCTSGKSSSPRHVGSGYTVAIAAASDT